MDKTPVGAIAINAHGVSHQFRTGNVAQRVLHEVDLAVVAGELTLIIGPSGSGKSTLLAIISGLLYPDAGTVQVQGVDLTRLSPVRREQFRQRYCGFVFQGFNLFNALSALENVALPLIYAQKLPRVQALARAAAMLDRVGLARQKALRPPALSGGEKQRVALARALIKNPAFLFADEPTSALDSENGNKVVDMLRHIAHQQGSTVVTVSHDHRLRQYAQRIIRLEDGGIIQDSCQPAGESVQ